MIIKELNLIGQQLANYKVIDKLGSGGMATVFKAHELSLNRMVALKVLSPQLSEDTGFIKRFQREAQAAAKLNHPNIVQVYAIGSDQGVHFFAMEYVKGQSLAEIKKEKGKLPPARAASIIRQVSEALAEAHGAGLVHRDIKPSNIMIDANGKPKVTDFGIAFVSEAKTKLTRDGSIIGTPEYLSPEQCEGKTVDGRSDLYSLGVTLYELLSGKTPYEADTPVSMLMKIVKGEFQPLGEVNPDVPQPLLDIVEKMMKTDPDERYGSMTEVADLLKQYGQPQTGNLSAPSAAAAVPGPVTGPETLAEEADTPTQTVEPVEAVEAVEQHYEPAKKKGPLVGLMIALTVVLLMGGIFAAKVFIFDKQDKPAGQAETVGNKVPVSQQAAGTAAAQETTAGETPGETAGETAGELTPETQPAGGEAVESTDPEALPGETPSGEIPEGEPGGEEVTTVEANDAPGGTPAETTAENTSGTPAESTTAAEKTTAVETTTFDPPKGTPPPDSETRAVSATTARITPPGSQQTQPAAQAGPKSAARTAPKAARKPAGPPAGKIGGRQLNRPPNAAKFKGPAAARGTVPKQAGPPPRSFYISTYGGDSKAGMIAAYAGKVFSRNKYSMREGRGGRYHLKITATPQGSSQLEYFGSSTTQYSVSVTMKVVDTGSGRIVAGPVQKIIEYTAINIEEVMQEEIGDLARKLVRKL